MWKLIVKSFIAHFGDPRFVKGTSRWATERLVIRAGISDDCPGAIPSITSISRKTMKYVTALAGYSKRPLFANRFMTKFSSF